MLGTLYWLAAILGLAGALAGNRVAWPLLASFVFYQVAQWQAWAFDRNLWATVDCAVLIFIAIVLFNEARKDRRWVPSASDIAVVFLFVPLMASYALEQAPAHLLSMTAAIAQLVIVFRPRRSWAGLQSSARKMSERRDEFDLRVTA